MELKNKFSLNIEEAISLLNNLSESLRTKGQFQFGVKDQEISVDVGSVLDVDLIFSAEYLSLVFNWDIKDSKTPQSIDWRSQFDEDMAKAGLPIESDDTVQEEETEIEEEIPYHPYLMVPEVKLPEELEQEKTKGEQEAVDAQTMQTPRHKLLDRMNLNTTTLPYDGGIWWPSFSPLDDSSWSEILINNELENVKWANEEQVISLSEITPVAPKHIDARRTAGIDDEDLFSDLDDFTDTPKVKTSKKRGSKSTTPPSNVIRKSASPPGIPTFHKESISEDIINWKEPTPENNVTNDNWVKPSEILKKQPIPSATKSDKLPISKIAVPKPSQISKRKRKQPDTDKTLHSAVNAMEDEIKDWKEPQANENVSEEKLVKPSELLKKKGLKKTTIPSPKKDIKYKKDRPPPKAPDKKKKGWADW